jgi:uncharacterized membrane protein
LFGLALAFLGIAVLIYFIHHIATSIQAAHILAAAADETLRAVDHLFPEEVGDEDDDVQPGSQEPGQAWHAVPSIATGYLQSLDTTALLAFANKRQTVVRMERGVGQFVIQGTPLLSVLRSPVTENARREINSLYAVGRQRTVEQDTAFGVRQIVDVALKALSPGINDTTTAVMCIDYLTAILVRLTARRIESRYRSKEGELRLLTCGPTYAGMVGESFDQIRQNGGGNLPILDGLLGSAEILGSCASPSRRRVLIEHVKAVAELANRTIPAPKERERIHERSSRILEILEAGNAA